MAGLTTAEQPLVSPLLDALHGRRIELAEGGGRGDLLTAYAFLHRRLHQTVTWMLEVIDHTDPFPALDAFLHCAGCAADLFDFYGEDVPGYIPALEKLLYKESSHPYGEDLVAARQPWASLRSRTQRQHAFLASVSGSYADGGAVSGFCLYGRRGRVLRINKRLFGDADACSYNWALRALLGDVLKAEVVLGAAIDKLIDSRKAEPLDCLNLALPYMALIGRVTARPKLGLPHEASVAMRAIRREGEAVHIGDVIEPGAGPFAMTLGVEFVGNAITIRLPYLDGEIEVVAKGKGGEALTSGIHRVAIRDVEVV